jgi:hypothetical protein
MLVVCVFHGVYSSWVMASATAATTAVVLAFGKPSAGLRAKQWRI